MCYGFIRGDNFDTYIKIFKTYLIKGMDQEKTKIRIPGYMVNQEVKK